MKNLHPLIPIAVMALAAAIRYFVLPHIDIAAARTLFNPLEVAAYAISVYAYARRPGILAAAYAVVPAVTLLMYGMFNFISAILMLIK